MKLLEWTVIGIIGGCAYMALIIAVGKGVDWIVNKLREWRSDA